MMQAIDILERLPQLEIEEDADDFALMLVICDCVPQDEVIAARKMGKRIGEA